MKRILTASLAALSSLAALAATTVPPQLINPAGSTAGQAIVSNGPSTAPTWQAVPLTGVTGVLPIANGGAGATTASAARSNLSAAFTGANTLTGAQTLAYSSPTLTLSDSSGTGTSRIQWQNNGTNVWSTVGDSSTSQWRLQRYVSGTLVDNPITVSVRPESPHSSPARSSAAPPVGQRKPAKPSKHHRQPRPVRQHHVGATRHGDLQRDRFGLAGVRHLAQPDDAYHRRRDAIRHLCWRAHLQRRGHVLEHHRAVQHRRNRRDDCRG